MIIRILRARLGGDDRGMALAAVIGAAAVLMLAVTVMLSSAVNTTVRTDNDQDFNNALAAAYAGLADYRSKLAADNSYQQYGNSAATFTGTSTFTSNPATAALASTKGGAWADILDSSSPAKPTGLSYRYEVDNSQYYSTGVIRLRVTGRSGKVTRSLIADLKGTGFINYLYFTDYETGDPTLSGSACTPQHLTDAGYNAATDCARIQFAATDVLGGPVRTNDAFTICGATFQRSVESTAANGAFVKPAGCSAPTFNADFNGGKTKYVPSIALPATNANLIQETRSDLTGSTVPSPGCLYTGPTQITFNGDGTMTVRSPWTKATQITGNPVSGGGAPAMCGTPSSDKVRGNTLNSTNGQKITMPPSNLIYVQNVPTTSDPANGWATGSYPAGLTCTGADGTTPGNGIGYPISNEVTSAIKVDTPYGCRTGDAFVSGAFSGAETVASQNFVYATGSISYKNAKTDYLGLVGERAVWVWNPFVKTCSRTCSTAPSRGYNSSFRIDAAIASNTGTFTVQNYDQGSDDMGTLTVNGSIAQKFRGPVATSAGAGVVGTGYAKAYAYDPRLQFTAPPKFLKPVSTTYDITTQVEVKAAYLADGTPKYSVTGAYLP